VSWLDSPFERVRTPRPLIPRRIGSGRGATEQPNAISDSPDVLSVHFWLLLLATGVATGLFGAGTMYLLHSAQHLAFSYTKGDFQTAVEHASWARRLVVLAIAGAIGGVGFYVVRRSTAGEVSEVHGTLWEGRSELSFRRSLPSGVLSEIVVGMGASLGREQAPQLLGAASGSLFGRWAKLSPGQRRLLVACGSGAGLAAVYNVPIGGALLIAELLYGTITLTVVLPALVCSTVATAVAWVYLPNQPTYLHLGSFHLLPTEAIWAILAGPVIGLISVAWIRLIGWTASHTVSGRLQLAAPLLAFVALGLVGFRYPELFGNGKDMAHSAFLGEYGIVMLLALFALKPLVTALCLGSGVTGGLFTPTFSMGAMLGGLLGGLWSLAFHGGPIAAYAVIGAGAMLGAGLQAPLAALVLTLELTNSTLGLAMPLLIATALATVTVRYLDGYSIYSSRLPARREADQGGPAPNEQSSGSDPLV
jgi:CIC family chloride channel protein